MGCGRSALVYSHEPYGEHCQDGDLRRRRHLDVEKNGNGQEQYQEVCDDVKSNDCPGEAQGVATALAWVGPQFGQRNTYGHLGDEPPDVIYNNDTKHSIDEPSSGVVGQKSKIQNQYRDLGECEAYLVEHDYGNARLVFPSVNASSRRVQRKGTYLRDGDCVCRRDG